MNILLNITAAIFLSILLVKSATWMIRSTSRLAKHFQISEYTVSFLIVAFATSLPELVVGIVSAIDKNPSLSYGNVLGSNIADLTIVLAIPILVGGAISTRDILKNKDIVFGLFFGLLPILLIIDGTLSQVDGLILVASYIFYLFTVFKRSVSIEAFVQQFQQANVIKELLIFIFSVVLMLLSADLLVKIAEGLSLEAKIPLFFVGLTVTALGTSLPELVFGLKAIKTNHKGEVLGTVVGSVIANSTLVLGATSIISPIHRDGNLGITSVFFLIFTLISFLVLSIINKKLSRIEAVFLLCIYIAFVVVERYLVKI